MSKKLITFAPPEDWHPTCMNVYYTTLPSGRNTWAFEYIPEGGQGVVRAQAIIDGFTCQRIADQLDMEDYGILALTPEHYQAMVKDWPKLVNVYAELKKKFNGKKAWESR